MVVSSQPRVTSPKPRSADIFTFIKSVKSPAPLIFHHDDPPFVPEANTKPNPSKIKRDAGKATRDLIGERGPEQ